MSWTAKVRHDNSLTSKEPHDAKDLEQEYLVNGTVINNMEKHDACGAMAPAIVAACSLAASNKNGCQSKGSNRCAVYHANVGAFPH